MLCCPPKVALRLKQDFACFLPYTFTLLLLAFASAVSSYVRGLVIEKVATPNLSLRPYLPYCKINFGGETNWHGVLHPDAQRSGKTLSERDLSARGDLDEFES